MMDYLAPLLNLALIHILMAMVPGPNTITVSYAAARISRGAGLRAAAGVALASLLWVTLSLVGIGALLAQAESLFRLMRFAGAAYLLYIGVKMLRSRPAEGAAEPGPAAAARSPFRAGFLTTLSNPKSAVFWTSVFAVVLPAGAPLWFHAAVPGLITLQAFLWYGLLALVFSARHVRHLGDGVARATSRLAGTFMLFFGGKILNDLRRELAGAL